jgi:dynein heavy chain 2
MKVDCIRVSTAPVKVTIDDHIQRLFDSLQSSLKRSIIDDLTTAETFLQSCLEVLSQRPQTVEEISKAAEKHHEFVTTKTTVKINKY